MWGISIYTHESHNVPALLHYAVRPVKHRRVVFDSRVDDVLKEVCLEIAARYEKDFLEIGTDRDHAQPAHDDCTCEKLVRAGDESVMLSGFAEGSPHSAYDIAGSGRSDAIRRVARLFKIIVRVSSQAPGRPLGRRELAEACDCDVRTVHRDLTLLQEAGIPVTYDYGQKAYLLPKSGWTFPIASLTGEDILALALLRGIAAAPGLPQAQELRAALDKLAGPLSPALSELMREAGRVLHPGQAARDYSAAPLTELLLAASGGRTVEIEYQSRSGEGDCTWRSVDPYVVEARSGRFWELHGWCHRNAAIRTFALDQVSGMRETGASFTVREKEWAEFSSAGGVVGGVRGQEEVGVDVVFTPPVAAYVRNQSWPSGLVVTSEPAGIVRLTGVVSGLSGLVPELLRWRRYCRVEGGAALRARMVEEVRAIAALYERSDADPCSDPAP